MRATMHRRWSDDRGFTLIEVLVSLVLLSLIMTAVTTLFFRSLRAADGLQDKQAAVPVATQAMDLARSVPAVRDAAGASRILNGRTLAAVTAQWASVSTLDGVDLSETYPAWDPTATASSTPTLPMSTTVLVSGQEFDVQTLVGVCFRAAVDSDCVKLSGYGTAPLVGPAGEVLLYRVIVVVTFTTANDTDCAAGCTYVTSTLIDPSVDPTFNTNDVTIPPPVAVGDSATINAANPGVATTIDVLSNDSGTFSTYPVVISLPPSRGTVTASSTGIVTYTPTNGASGTDYFTYYLRDVTGRTSTAATVAITLNPRASADGFTTGRGRAVTYNLKTNDVGTFPSSGTTCITVTSGPSNGAIALGTCGSITYTPTGSFTGTDSFRYTITDTSALVSNEVTATVTVYPPPTAVNDSATTNATVAVTIPVQANDTLPAGSATTSIVTTSANGTATVSGTSIVVHPERELLGDDVLHLPAHRHVHEHLGQRHGHGDGPSDRGRSAGQRDRRGQGRVQHGDQLHQGGVLRQLPDGDQCLGKPRHCQRRDLDLHPQGRLHGHGHRDLHGDRHVRTDRLRHLVGDGRSRSDGGQ